nr:hypothetical protein [Pedosphaera parvula]
MELLDLPFVSENCVEVPWPETRLFGKGGGLGGVAGLPSSQVNVKVTLSPSVIVSRSNEAVKFAASASMGRRQRNAKMTHAGISDKSGKHQVFAFLIGLTMSACASYF